MNPLLSEADKVRKFFSDFAATWDALYGGKRNAFWRFFDNTLRRDIYERYWLTFERLGANLGGKSVLDIGCGSGVYCIEAARRGAAKVCGIDVSQNMIELAKAYSREFGYENICQFICSSFPASLPLFALEQTFNYGIVMGVMDYVSNPNAFLKCVRDQITDSAIISFPGQHWLRGPIRQYRYKMLGRCAVYNYSEGSIREACLKAGFRRADIQRLDHSGICFIVTAYS
jgi:2-polyprenyl-3-methyl-5-hydroxy-6-metoxy-1,4-benzoquinol methylase